MIKNNNIKQIGIYVHIPFCVSKCNYCSFFSCNRSEEFIENYVKNLLIEIEKSSFCFKQYEIISIYFGGGTPSFIDQKHIKNIINCIKNNYNVLKNAEISIECNPCSVNFQKLKFYKDCGFNRVSFGVQSLNDNCLKIINRKHTKEGAIRAILDAKKAGFENISADLLIGIPNQTKEDLLNDIKTLVSLDIKHISCYMLMLEEGTCLYEKVMKKQLTVASDDDCVNMYKHSYSLLKEYGFSRYEISNFSLSGFECKHNLNYWNEGEYLGFGVSACGFVNNIRVTGFSDFEKYYNYCNLICKTKKTIYDLITNLSTNQLEQFSIENKDLKNQQNLTGGESCIFEGSSFEYISDKVKCEEMIMLGLRLKKGVCLSDLKKLGYDLLKEKREVVESYIKTGAICIENDHLFITDDFFGASNKIILDLI